MGWDMHSTVPGTLYYLLTVIIIAYFPLIKNS